MRRIHLGTDRPLHARHSRSLGVLSLFGVTLLAAATTATPRVQAEEGPSPIWTIVPTEHLGVEQFSGVAALSRDDAWAVGDRMLGSGRYIPIIEHWNGRLWRAVEGPRLVQAGFARLLDVAGSSSDDVWAVGGRHAWEGSEALFEHWDGTEWKLVKPPATLYTSSWLWSVEALAADDVWAGGLTSDWPGEAPLIEHWDGASWRVVPTPTDIGAAIQDFSAISADDVWAVGSSFRKPNQASRPLVLHWDGDTWTRVAMPNPGPAGAWLEGVAAVSPDDVWVVGSKPEPDTYRDVPLIQHWNGRSWSIVQGAPIDYGWLGGVVAISNSDIWAVGEHSIPNVGFRAMVQHWDGETWSIVRSGVGPGGKRITGYLDDIEALDSGELWAVGERFYADTLAMRYGVPFCSDGRDNDRDGATDHPGDTGCISAEDGSEFAVASCDDGYDDDHDGRTDFPRDPGCSGSSDRRERGTIQCDDGLDNDSDYRRDYRVDGLGDRQCASPFDSDESS